MITFSGSNIYWIDQITSSQCFKFASSSARDFENDAMSRQYFHTMDGV